ncbi:MAG: phosphoglucosamine mutase [Ruminococcaceae bacterium]|nr:phosphoglucosamine mutase [Oscillospiraceae bacterium]
MVLLCDLFHISTDELLRPEISLEDAPQKRTGYSGNGHYFGTDGFRGEANLDLTAEQAYKVGRFLGWFYASPKSGCYDKTYRPRFVIGKDTRRSSYMLEYAIAAGITASGGDVYMLHVTTTPSVSYVTKQDEFDCGIMISASHNAYQDNGIKLISRSGEKLGDETLALVEAYLDGNIDVLLPGASDLPLAHRERVGAIYDHVSGRNRYMGYLISIVTHSFRSMRVGLDCANGASWMIAPAIFDALGARTYVINSQPDGMNINKDAGSTHIEGLQKLVKEKKLDVGFAFDGDADRCIAVDENGEIVSGDHILYILSKRMKRKNMLKNNTLVTTVMSNKGLFKALQKADIDTVQTRVGDRYVYEAMLQDGYALGGEQSGHIIIQKYATTGDGILTALMLMMEILDCKTTLGKLASPVVIYPQILINVTVKDKSEAMNDPEVSKLAQAISEELGDEGRLLLRPSGTEPYIRVMVEAESESRCHRLANEMAELLKERCGV